MHGDHLGSTSVTSGWQPSKQWYYAYGGVRASEGTLPTDYTFTGQKADASDGLMYYNARYYDAAIGRFIQPDSIVPNPLNPQDLNRYTYTRNNPLRYTDPNGHCGPLCVVVGIGVALVVALANPSPGPSASPLALSEGELAFLDSAPGTGDISDLYTVITERRLFTGEAQNRLEAGLPAALPVVTGGMIKQTTKLLRSEAARTVGKSLIKGMSEQEHHILSDKHTSKWTERFKDIADQYGLDLNGAWNKIDIRHQPKGHADQYHEWVYEKLMFIHGKSKGDVEKFLDLFEKEITVTVRDNPWIVSN